MKFSGLGYLLMVLFLTNTSVATEATQEPFVLDVPETEIPEMIGIYAVSNLVVGEKGRVNKWSICRKGNKLFVPTRSMLVEKNKYFASFVVLIRPGMTAELFFEPSDDTDSETDRTSSELKELFHPANIKVCLTDDKLLPVFSIEGFSRLSDLLEQL